MAMRMTVRVSDEDYRLVKEKSEEYGLTMAQFGGFCLKAGIRAVIRAVNPEDAISASKIAEIATEIEKLNKLSSLGSGE